ncbi:MAG: DUF362 domain-containing protein [Candidatus Brocadiia bacterium]|jgi:hypothetical protein|nr:DUF362 domain-containing protein [Candidatus Brocadiia bacterium]
MKPKDFPALTGIRQRFKSDRLTDLPGELRKQLDASGVSVGQGDRVAIAVGSRGIADIVEIVRGVAEWVRGRGAEPFIVPAMGSHGGATAEGQERILKDYGVTEANTGAPVLSDMAVVELPQGTLPVKVYFDRNAFQADATIAVNRIKVHTDYHGPYESGLMKMLVIGLGKQAQATAIHTHGVRGLREVIPQVARQILAHANVIMGVAIVENAYDQTMLVRAIPAQEIPDREPELLAIARVNMPSLPVDELDILIIDEMGKDISGAGIDTNIIGRMMIAGEPEPDSPRIASIVVRDITDVSHGNAVGVGLADIITRRLFEKIDLKITYANLITSTFLERGKIPIIAEDDREAIGFAWRAAGSKAGEEVKVARIRNTLQLAEMYVSPAVLNEIRDDDAIEVTGPTVEPFDSGGELFPFGNR